MFSPRLDESTEREREQPRREPEHARRPSAEAVLALQRSAGNQAVARTLGRRVIARFPSFSGFLTAKGKKADSENFRNYRIESGYTAALNAAKADKKRTPENLAAISTMELAIGDALTGKKWDDLESAVNNMAKLLESGSATLAVATGWEQRAEAPRPAAPRPQPGAEGAAQPAAPMTWALTAVKKSKGGFKTKLSNKEQSLLMQEWAGKLNHGTLGNERQVSSLLEAAKGTVITDITIRLDGEAIQADRRYQVFRIQGSDNATYPVLGGFYLQLGVAFDPGALEAVVRQSLKLAHESQYAVLFDSTQAYVAPK
ncbi:hypothetical protein OJ998_31600 [Solirubrobacter taibaiensis]|nr:hypothetical protein [Solirubrobacter taibaiensis]